MRHSNITATCPIDNQLVLDKDISLLNMANPTGKKISAKASTDKPSGKPPPGDRIFGLEASICLYEKEDGDETKKIEKTEILVVYYSNLAESKQKLIKSQFSYIDTFNHEGPMVINTMRDLTAEVFEHL